MRSMMPVVVYIWCASETGRVTEVPCLVKTLLAFCELCWHSGFWHLGPDLVSTCGLARRCHRRHHMNEKGLNIDPCETPWARFHPIVIGYLVKAMAMYVYNTDLIVCAIFLISQKRWW